MATQLSSSMRTMSSQICRQCATATAATARRTFTSTTAAQSSKNALRMRSNNGSSILSRTSTQQPSQSATRGPLQPRRTYKTVEEAKSKYRLGPFSWQAGLLFLIAGGGLTLYFRYEKARMSRARIAEANKGIGKPLVGGSFHLTDHNGADFSEANLKGKYTLVYFGFTHCPDICPEELDKMAGMIDLVREKHGAGVLKPIFISCDPARDTPEVMKSYLKEFHEEILGMTGTWDEVKEVCKAYRVYFSTPKDVKPGQDYLVDHSIYFYLMDPEGDFVEAIGRNFTTEAAAKVINDHVADWRGKIDRS